MNKMLNLNNNVRIQIKVKLKVLFCKNLTVKKMKKLNV